MKLLQLIALFLATGFAAKAQQYELGEVTKAELEEKSHPTDPSAGAAILFSKGKTYMTYSDNGGFDLVTEVEMKIKIYSKDGYEWANKVIPYYSNDNNKESVDISKAATYNLVNGAVKKTKLKSEGEFDEQVNKFWRQKKIVLADVKEGSIVEYKYTVRSPFIETFPAWTFQETIPVNHSEYVTMIPEYFMYNTNFRGFYVPKVAKTTATKSISITSKERTGNYVTKTTFSTDKIEYQEQRVSYVLDRLPAMKEESFVNNVLNYTASIEHELTIVKYPNTQIKSYSTNWEDVVKTIYKYDDFGPELERTGYFDKDIDALLAGVSSPAEKVMAIFFYVKGRMNWNEYVGYSCNSGVKKAYNDKVGNVAEINLMLTAMLRYAGLNANPVLVSTRSNKIALYPNRTAFNYVITAVEIDGKILLLDATSKSAMPNIIPPRAINWTGRLIRKDGTSESIELTPKTNAREVVNISVQLDAEGKIKGKARDQYFDHNAYAFRENFGGVSKESCMEKLEKRYKGIEIQSYNITDDKSLNKPVVEEYDFTHNNICDIIGGKMYINPMLFFTETENPFRQEKREYPIDFVYPHQDKYMINIMVPEGYVVESSPTPVNMAMEDGIGSFKYNIGVNNNQIQIGVMIDINQAIISQDYYATIKDFFQKMIDKQNEKIVLKKA
ncbi:transglutaminase [Flavobacterium album]|uniref:Transglutaminase n=1 Tax=Flavobacterium album TaxID=2175091 RepID=A0A2S1QX87_9FLAO|nr:DUF3857 domain-containing protein [Flavobacterium album]AWH85016.1 transglutaminase [Flavobacterium album]